jgi:hypothetical protein
MERRSSTDDSVVTVPTEGPSTSTRVREIDVSTMNDQDLKALRKADPFMYYSIPQVIKAFRCNIPIDHSSLGITQGDAAAGQAQALPVMVSRKTRISDSCDFVQMMAELSEMGLLPENI